MDTLTRRQFLAQTSFAAASASISIDADDPIASAPPVRWAASELENALAARQLQARIVAAGRTAPVARRILGAAGVSVPDVPEALAIVPAKDEQGPLLLACGRDVRGLVFALLEIADRVRHGQPPEFAKPVSERPANVVRSVTRCFVSEVEDKPWFYDLDQWRHYLGMLAAQRFNRFSLAFGIGYDFTWEVRDSYLHFPYPFLLNVPGYKVRVTGLTDAERERNLDTLRFVARETAARGLHFQLAVWTHAYLFDKSPNVSHTVEGLTPEIHAPYCRDALRMLLRQCPEIQGVTFRVHGESGVPEGSYGLWKTIFDGVARSGRLVEIDMHAKGIDQGMIDAALATGMPVKISPKYWAEHMGLPYHQTAIRELEMPRARKDEGFFALSSGSRSFMRYGYGDLLREDRRYGVLHRLWPGTQRLLLWGDPVFAAACSRSSSFCGSSGVEICEPLTFKGRKGSGLAGGRCAYADETLAPKYDWEKYLYTYRVWGRLLYNPDSEPDVWRRSLRAQFRAASSAVEPALARASRILPLFTMAHCPSAANNLYWPEMYTNMSIGNDAAKHPYGDSPAPKRFGTVSPLDPELFARVDDFAGDLLAGVRGAKYTPAEVAQWLLREAAAAEKHLMQADAAAPRAAEFRRLAIDVAIQAGLGRFFAWKLRSGVFWALYDRTGDRAALEEALKAYHAARTSWAALAERAKGVYRSDVTYGWDAHARGHWLDRLPAIDADIADMETRAPSAVRPNGRVALAIREVLSPPPRPQFQPSHTPHARFAPGRPLELQLLARQKPGAARLHYRHVNQAERWRTEEMRFGKALFTAAIPADYTASPFPLEYYFELRDAAGAAALFPGLKPDFSNQPYYAVRPT
jgi:hypothetical protein